MQKKILITGGTGLIGRRLTAMLLEEGNSVVHLSRSAKGTVPTFQWDVKNKTIDDRAFEDVDVIIHLAGAGIGDKRWTAKRKREILDTRVASTQLLFETIKKLPKRPTTFISASGIAFYGLTDKKAKYTEKDEQGSGFLADVVRDWESAADQFSALGLRVVKIRTGLVLSREGGALKPMTIPVKYYFGSPLGSGKQPMSWIHIDDLCRIYMEVIKSDEMQGAYNAVTTNVVSNKTFTKQLGKALKKPIILPAVPEFALRLVLGEMADLIVTGTTVYPERLLDSGFRFQFESLETALAEIFPEG